MGVDRVLLACGNLERNEASLFLDRSSARWLSTPDIMHCAQTEVELFFDEEEASE